MTDRKVIADLYVRNCRDSGYKMSSVEAAKITAAVLKIHPLSVMGALTFAVMEQIATGDHPACRSPALTGNDRGTPDA